MRKREGFISNVNQSINIEGGEVLGDGTLDVYEISAFYLFLELAFLKR